MRENHSNSFFCIVAAVQGASLGTLGGQMAHRANDRGAALQNYRPIVLLLQLIKKSRHKRRTIAIIVRWGWASYNLMVFIASTHLSDLRNDCGSGEKKTQKILHNDWWINLHLHSHEDLSNSLNRFNLEQCIVIVVARVYSHLGMGKRDERCERRNRMNALQWTNTWTATDRTLIGSKCAIIPIGWWWGRSWYHNLKPLLLL